MFLTKKPLRAKGKAVKAIARFTATKNQVGKIVMDKISNLCCRQNVLYAKNSFEKHQADVIAYLPKVGTTPFVLKSNGIVGGNLTIDAFQGKNKVAFAYDNYTKSLFVSHVEVGTYQITAQGLEKISSLGFDCLALCQSKLWGLEKDVVYFTSLDGDFSTWENIILPGSASAIVADDHLFAVGNNVYKINPDGKDIYAKVTTIFQNVGDVCPQTVCVFANRILCVANNRVVILRSGYAKQVIDGHFDSKFATCHEGLYYVACQNKVLAIDILGGDLVASYCLSCDSLFAQDRVYATSNGVGYQLVQKPCASYWKSQPISFDGESATKYLHRLVITTRYNVDVHVLSDARRIYHVAGKDTPQSLLICGYGKDICVELHSAGKLFVSNLQLVARAYKGDN